MLYDPRRDAQTKPDIYALPTLIAWLEKQPARQTYCYDHVGKCLITQYLREHLGGQRVFVGYSDFYVIDPTGKWGPDIKLPPGFNDIAIESPRTYGAALVRARNLLWSRK